MSTNYSIPTPIIPFAPPVYAARFNPKPFTLDGRLDKEFWADIPFTDLFADIEGPSRPTPRFATRAKIAQTTKTFILVPFLRVMKSGDILPSTMPSSFMTMILKSLSTRIPIRNSTTNLR